MGIYEMLFWIVFCTVVLMTLSSFKPTKLIADVLMVLPKAILKRTIPPLIGAVVADHTKRIVVASSLCSHVVCPKSKELDDQLIQKLYQVNDTLHLTDHSTEAVLYPAAIHSFIWGNDPIDVNLASADASAIAGLIPKWLRYGTVEEMTNDIKEVLRLSQSPAMV